MGNTQFITQCDEEFFSNKAKKQNDWAG